ncbi:kynurenine 3-monooxygenase [Delitschia confertaspora ATCC 74209]|uniref:Kynurenine 3-monooxygenase n=1 Tax=Delitschia confertaspora ATCC 74209 TaxID=1513339 RepID=A0A9P4JQZ2_9PLEO|nr:kynurenine 3-monooxygenase [Delitschia confertaspora ATCC 74209]
MPRTTVVVGAGPVGSLAALYAAVRGDHVEVYELRPDLRDPNTIPLNFAKSINLALSERGINALRHTGLSELVNSVLDSTFPMRGRMIHGKKNGKLFQNAQLYDARGKNLLAMDRTGLNKTLLDHLEAMPNVKLLFNHKLVGADLRKNLAWFERKDESNLSQVTEIEVNFDFLIGADGAHSAVRYHLMKVVPMTYQQEYIDKLWCQFHVPPSSGGDFRLPPNYLHIWPQDEAMFIALPNLDKTFTSTLFLTRSGFEELDKDSGAMIDYFNDKFPGVVPDLITEDELRKQYTTNQHLPLISIKCSPYHYGSSCVIVGDAAHAMVPFYGQGMNAGLEDVRVLFEFLDQYPANEALANYTKQRTPDAQAINDLALRNYREMATDVKKPLYLVRKWIEEALDLYLPSAGWATQYSRVTFSNMRYSEVELASKRQARILSIFFGLVAASILGSTVWFGRSAGFRVRNNSLGWMTGIFRSPREVLRLWSR